MPCVSDTVHLPLLWPLESGVQFGQPLVLAASDITSWNVCALALITIESSLVIMAVSAETEAHYSEGAVGEGGGEISNL